MRSVQVSVAPPAAILASMATPSARLTITTGMVMGGEPATVGLTRPATLL